MTDKTDMEKMCMTGGNDAPTAGFAMEAETDCAPVFTVLVAVYNASATLSRCLDSLLGQTERSLQVVCIDDCSTDGSLDVLRRYAQADSRVEIVALDKNSGPAHARNAGLQRARGRYTAFVDSDDWLGTDALEQCRRVFEADTQTDSVVFDTVAVLADEGDKHEPMGWGNDKSLGHAVDGRRAFELSLTWGIHGVYAVRTELHRRFPYDETCRTYSDDNTTRLHYLNSRRVAFCRGVYYYWRHSGSVTLSVDLSRLDYLMATESMKRKLLELAMPDSVLNVYETERWLIVMDTCFFLYRNRHRFSRAELKAAAKVVRHHWASIEIWRVARKERTRLGHWPLQWSWWLFCLQVYCYFTLRRWGGHDRNVM